MCIHCILFCVAHNGPSRNCNVKLGCKVLEKEKASKSLLASSWNPAQEGGDNGWRKLFCFISSLLQGKEIQTAQHWGRGRPGLPLLDRSSLLAKDVLFYWHGVLHQSFRCAFINTCAEMPCEDALSVGAGVYVKSTFTSHRGALKWKKKSPEEKFTPSDLQWRFYKSVTLLMPHFLRAGSIFWI